MVAVPTLFVQNWRVLKNYKSFLLFSIKICFSKKKKKEIFQNLSNH